MSCYLISGNHLNRVWSGAYEEHYKQAREHIAKHEPSYYDKVQQAIQELESHKQEHQNQKAREHGADIYAQKGKNLQGRNCAS